MTIKFKSFSSGSCGNCYFLGTEEEGTITSGILIDAGVSPRRVKQELVKEGLTEDCFSALLITHDHWDHIKSLGSYCKRVKVPVWASTRLHNALARHPGTSDYLHTVRHDLSEGWTEIIPWRVRAHAFEVPHDASHTVGYALEMEGFRFVLITDCGRITQEALSLAGRADAVVIESNYDPEMLKNGPYPPDLQARIRGGHGHLSNRECADAIHKFSHEGLGHIFLCHLSEHNNTPMLALNSAREAAPDRVRVCALPRTSASPLFTLP